MLTHADTREWLTPQELALELRVHVSSVYRAVDRGDLRAVRLASKGPLRIPRSAIEELAQR